MFLGFGERARWLRFNNTAGSQLRSDQPPKVLRRRPAASNRGGRIITPIHTETKGRGRAGEKGRDRSISHLRLRVTSLADDDRPAVSLSDQIDVNLQIQIRCRRGIQNERNPFALERRQTPTGTSRKHAQLRCWLLSECLKSRLLKISPAAWMWEQGRCLARVSQRITPRSGRAW